MRILVTFAADAEFAPWRRIREFLRQEGDGAPLYRATIGSAEVLVGITGMGPDIPAFRLGTLLAKGPNVCISSGLAGGLKSRFQHAEILAAAAVQAFRGDRRLAADAGLLQQAVNSGATRADLFLTVDRMISRVTEKRELGATADAVEMESFDVLRAAESRGVRSLAVRAISDLADEELPVFGRPVINADGSVRLGRVLSHVAAHPADVPKLVRLGRQSRQASESLCEFLDGLVEALSLLQTEAKAEALAL